MLQRNANWLLLLQLASHMQLVQRLLSDSSNRQGLDIFEVAEGLRKLGHAVTIRSALGGGGGNECLRNLRHRFLTCCGQGMLLCADFAPSLQTSSTLCTDAYAILVLDYRYHNFCG